jgi:hypothetical protein
MDKARALAPSEFPRSGKRYSTNEAPGERG